MLDFGDFSEKGDAYWSSQRTGAALGVGGGAGASSFANACLATKDPTVKGVRSSLEMFA